MMTFGRGGIAAAALVAVASTVFPSGAAGMGWPQGLTEEMLCANGACDKPLMKYEQILPGQPGYQWNDAGGYCGSMSTQRATLMRGAYISQAQVRNHTFPGGGHDNEILTTNIEDAYTNLKLVFEGFNYRNHTVPMQGAYFKWLKKQLVEANPVVWFIMWDSQHYPIYQQGIESHGFKAPPAGIYGHVEPVMGIQSNHPLTDETVYDDDLVVHFNNGGLNTIYRKIQDLPGKWSGVTGDPGECIGKYCIGPYSFGWAIKGFADNHASKPATLAIDPSRSEPDTRAGETPNNIRGTLTCNELEVGSDYEVYRWDTVEDAFSYRKEFLKHSFTATAPTFVYEDPKTFKSDSATYYRCVPNN